MKVSEEAKAMSARFVDDFMKLMQHAREHPEESLDKVRAQMDAEVPELFQPILDHMEARMSKVASAVIEIGAGALEKYDVISGASAAAILRRLKD